MGLVVACRSCGLGGLIRQHVRFPVLDLGLKVAAYLLSAANVDLVDISYSE